MAKKGRPNGAKNIDTIQTAELPRCPACGCTDRDEYTNARTFDVGGTRADGTPFTHVVKKNTRCRGCGQARIDQFLENRAAPLASAG